MSPRALAAEGFEGIVIGGDSMFEIGGEILGKPYTPEAATVRWRQMRGRTGMLHSGHSVIRVGGGMPSAEAHAVAAASVSFAADVTDAEIDAYVASGEPLHVAGAFTIDSLGGAFIDRVDGDPSTVVGMSLSTVRGSPASWASRGRICGIAGNHSEPHITARDHS